MIAIKDLSKRFTFNKVVDNINLHISEGEIVGLLGPNGAGKTTTLRMIAGVLPPTSGLITVNGENIMEDGSSAKEHIGFLPENNPLFEEMTVEEYLLFWAQIKGLRSEDGREAIQFVIEHCGISEVYYRPIAELSKGFRQRVGLSQAILTKPDILILDEPTEGLDPNQRHDIAQLIKTLGKKRTVIISSHVLSELVKMTSRMIVIHRGKIVADATPENLRKMGGKSNTIMAEIKGKNILPVLKKLPGIIDIAVQKNTYEITTDGETDLREKIFDTSVTHKWKLLTLMQKQKEIEEVFSQLTSN